MIRQLTFTGVLLLVVFSFLGGLAHGQGSQKEVDKRIISVDLEKKSLGEIVKVLISKYDVRIGFEFSTLNKDVTDYRFETNEISAVNDLATSNATAQVRVSVTPNYSDVTRHFSLRTIDKPLSKVLDELVLQLEDYSWSVDGEVINFIPTKSRSDNLRELLELRIKDFEVSKYDTLASVMSNIEKIPEIRNFLADKNLKLSTRRGGSSISARIQNDLKMKKPLQLKDIPFRDLLNRIAESKGGGWIARTYVKSSPDETYIYISL